MNLRSLAIAMGVSSLTLMPLNSKADFQEELELATQNPKQWFLGKVVKNVNNFTEQLEKELEEGIFEGMWEILGESIGESIGSAFGEQLASIFSLSPLINIGSIININQPSEAQELTKIILRALEKVEANIINSIEAQYVDEVLDDMTALKYNYADHNSRADHKLRLTDGDVIEIAYMPAAMDIIGAFEGSIQSKVENLHNYTLVNTLWIQMLYEDVQYDFVQAYGDALYNLNQTEIVTLLNDPSNKLLMENDYKLRLKNRVDGFTNHLSSLNLDHWKQANAELYASSTGKHESNIKTFKFQYSEPVCTWKWKCDNPWQKFKNEIQSKIGAFVLEPCNGTNKPKYPIVTIEENRWSYIVNGKKIVNKYYYTQCHNESEDIRFDAAAYIYDSKGNKYTHPISKPIFWKPSLGTYPARYRFVLTSKQALDNEQKYNLPRMVIAGYSPVQQLIDSWWEMTDSGYTRPHNSIDMYLYQYDVDGDGLTNGAEATYGTNPNLTDSDYDGRSDYEEIMIDGTNPTGA